MKKKVMSLNGDSRGAGNGKSEVAVAKVGSAAVYKTLRIGQPFGKPSVPESKIVAAVRAVMKEDGMI